jgi:hypothetical protein
MPLPRTPSTREASASIAELRARQQRVAALCAGWPETTATQPYDTETWSFEVAGKRFAYGLYQHLGDDGRSGVVMKAPPGAQEALVGDDPDHFWVPAFIGRHGWVGLRLDLDEPDWDAVAALLRDAWRLAAPKRVQRLPGAP